MRFVSKSQCGPRGATTVDRHKWACLGPIVQGEVVAGLGVGEVSGQRGVNGQERYLKEEPARCGDSLVVEVAQPTLSEAAEPEAREAES